MLSIQPSARRITASASKDSFSQASQACSPRVRRSLRSLSQTLSLTFRWTILVCKGRTSELQTMGSTSFWDLSSLPIYSSFFQAHLFGIAQHLYIQNAQQRRSTSVECLKAQDTQPHFCVASVGCSHLQERVSF